MKINIDKTVYQIFSLKHKIEEPDIKIKKQSIKRSNSTNYLGIILGNKLSLKQHTEKQIAKANNKAEILKRLAGSEWGSNTATPNTTYRTYRVSQEECARLREGVPYVKVCQYNPKHQCPKLNGYRDNGQRS
jgi:hypothetical protein